MSKSKKVIAALGVAAVLGGSVIPLSSYAVDPASTSAQTVKVTIADAIKISLEDKSGNGISMEANSTVDSKYISGATEQNRILHKLTVTTNSDTGYTITMKDGDTNNALVNTANANAEIPSFTDEDSALEAGVAHWGWQTNTGNDVETQTSITNKWNPVPKSDATAPAEIFEHTAPAEAQYSEVTYVRYGVATSEDQAAGTYQGSVVYTATVRQ